MLNNGKPAAQSIMGTLVILVVIFAVACGGGVISQEGLDERIATAVARALTEVQTPAPDWKLL